MNKIIVCLKQVPDKDVKMDWKKGRLIRNSASNCLNPDDYHAIELALNLKEKYKESSIYAITLGPPQAEEILREAYSFGVDHCILITDPQFAGSDTLITSKILYETISTLKNVKIIVTGKKSTDGDTGNVSYQLSEYFKLPHLTQIHDISIENEQRIIVKRIYGHEYQKVKVNLPVIISATKNTNKVRYPRLIDIKQSFSKNIQKITLKDLPGNEKDYGQKGSPTITLEGELFQHSRKNEVVEGTTDEKIDFIINKLKKYSMLEN